MLLLAVMWHAHICEERPKMNGQATFAALQLQPQWKLCYPSPPFSVCRVVCLMLFNGRFPASGSRRGLKSFQRYADIKMV